jgi:antitoxin CptB
MEAANRRILWRCRRGLLELDIVLQGFVEESYAALNAAQLKAFDALLDLPDNDLWERVCFRVNSQDQQQEEILSMMGGTRRGA